MSSCQFGGQTPLNIASELAKAGVKILGTTPETIDLAEDRDRFGKMMEKLGIPSPNPAWRAPWMRPWQLQTASDIRSWSGHPMCLGGRGMEVVHDEDMLRRICPRGR